MKVSVVIPVYNEEKRITNCLDSLMNQSEKPDEIIVVDNNSTDKTVEIAEKYKGVKVIGEKKQGITPTRNKGFNSAQYEIIARCDADTRVPPDWIQRIKNDFTNDENIMAISTPVTFYDIPIIRRSIILFYFYIMIPRLMIGCYPLVGISFAVRKTAWNKIKGELCLDDKKVHEDIDLTIHIKKLGKIYHDSKIIALSSGRRLRYNPLSFFGEYTIRFFKMYWDHRHLI